MKSSRDRLKIEYYVPRQLQLSLFRLKDNDYPFRVIDSYIHRHGTFLSELNRSLICVSVSMYVRVFLFYPRYDYIKIERWNADDCIKIQNQHKRKEDRMQHKNFFMVPNRIFDLELKPRDFTVYCCLLRHSDSKDGSCFPSRRVIAKECGMDRKTVDSAIENLSYLGLIKKIQRYREDGTRTSNLYYVASLLE